MHTPRPIITLSLLLVLLTFLGAGCLISDDTRFPPKPPVPGFDKSPAIDALTP